MKLLSKIINICLVLNIALTSPALIFAQEYGDTQDDPGQSSQSGFDYGTPYSYPTPNYATPGGYGADDPGGSTVEHYGTPSTPYSYPTPTYPTPVYPTPAYPSLYEAGDPGGDNNGWDTSVPDAETEPADTPAEENPDNYNNAFNEGFNAVYNGEALTCSSSACQQGKDAAAASIERQAAEQALVDQRRGERAGSNVNVREADQGGGGFDLFGGVTGFVGGVFSGIGTVAHDTLDGVTGLLPDEGICLINCNQALNDQFNSDFNQGFNSVYTGGNLACQSDACRSGVAAATEVINHPPASAQVLGLTTEGYTNGLATTFGVEPGVTPEETVRRINLATTGTTGLEWRAEGEGIVAVCVDPEKCRDTLSNPDSPLVAQLAAGMSAGEGSAAFLNTLAALGVVVADLALKEAAKNPTIKGSVPAVILKIAPGTIAVSDVVTIVQNNGKVETTTDRALGLRAQTGIDNYAKCEDITCSNGVANQYNVARRMGDPNEALNPANLLVNTRVTNAELSAMFGVDVSTLSLETQAAFAEAYNQSRIPAQNLLAELVVDKALRPDSMLTPDQLLARYRYEQSLLEYRDASNSQVDKMLETAAKLAINIAILEAGGDPRVGAVANEAFRVVGSVRTADFEGDEVEKAIAVSGLSPADQTKLIAAHRNQANVLRQVRGLGTTLPEPDDFPEVLKEVLAQADVTNLTPQQIVAREALTYHSEREATARIAIQPSIASATLGVVPGANRLGQLPLEAAKAGVKSTGKEAVNENIVKPLQRTLNQPPASPQDPMPPESFVVLNQVEPIPEDETEEEKKKREEEERKRQMGAFIPTAYAEESRVSQNETLVMDSDVFDLSVKYQLIQDAFATFGVLNTELSNEILDTPILQPLVYAEDGTVTFVTGKNGMTTGAIDDGRYKVSIGALPGFDITVPKYIDTKAQEKHLIPVVIKEGSGKINYLSEAVEKSLNLQMEVYAEGTTGSLKDITMTVFHEEKIPPLAGVRMNLIPIKSKVGLDLLTGWNLIAVPGKSDVDLTARTLIDLIRAQGGNAVAVAGLENGAWKEFVSSEGKTYSVADFPIESGKGYFIKTTQRSTLTFPVTAILEPSEIKLESGWNAVGIPDAGSRTFRAGDVLNKANANSMAAFASGTWDSFVRVGQESYGNNFPISSRRGYLIKSEKAGNLKL